jgi:phosphatidylserine/phosphatidylglycerophosphate/cardiolipin synthase-like enzyme
MAATRRKDLVEFIERAVKRNPALKEHYAQRLKGGGQPRVLEALEAPATAADLPALLAQAPDKVLETIVSEERPVLFIEKNGLNFTDMTVIGIEAQQLVDQSKTFRAIPEGLLGRVGRIDLIDFPGGAPFAGTGWLVDAGIIVTNRHVAEVFARRQGSAFVFRQGANGAPVGAAWDTGHLRDETVAGLRRPVAEVLYIEPPDGPNDIAFLRLASTGPGDELPPFEIAPADASEHTLVFTLGYPAKASQTRIPDQDLMQRLYLGKYDVKRFAPGFIIPLRLGRTAHDCTTLGGNSGSVVADMKTGKVLGLHFSGIYKEANLAVPASELRRYVSQKLWNQPLVIETAPRPVAPVAPVAALQSAIAGPDGSVSITVPLTITVSLGGAAVAAAQGGRQAQEQAASVEAAVEAFWAQRSKDVIAARVGYFEENGEIGDTPCIAVSVAPQALEALRTRGPQTFQGYPVTWAPATVEEQIDSLMDLEAAGHPNAYDDDARTGSKFELKPVSEPMTVRAHLSPEFGFDELAAFMSEASNSWVSAIYEFRGRAIRDLMAERIRNGTKIRLAADFKTFVDPEEGDELVFDAKKDFASWARRFPGKFERIAVPAGGTGLIQQAYHIKVTVRDDDTFWLSSGNWKNSSSQPIVSDEQRANFAAQDLGGNREWHVIVKSPTLADRFRNHILQDMKRSHDLGAGEEPVKSKDREPLVDIPEGVLELLEAPSDTRRPPARLLEPLKVVDEIRATPLLTPDEEGAIYSKAVLKLIRSAERSLLFQIPYIGMPKNPREHRGFIDDLIGELTEKLVSLPDARVLLRGGKSRGKEFSDPAHAAFFFKSKGVDIARRVKSIVDHHTKGMVVDGKRVLVGSHNWSGMGVSTNRDASLIFENKDLAGYFADAFQIDWDRADRITPKKFVKPAKKDDESPVLMVADTEAPERPGYRRMRLSDYLAMLDD